MVAVYGVQVPGADGRAGMAALLLSPEARFDGEALYRLTEERLPRYAAPVFVRLIRDMDLTGTFKLRKVTLQAEGFDLERVTDPIHVRDDDAGSYVPLTPAIAAAIADGTRRL